jgi:hypothetical protein
LIFRRFAHYSLPDNKISPIIFFLYIVKRPKFPALNDIAEKNYKKGNNL